MKQFLLSAILLYTYLWAGATNGEQPNIVKASLQAVTIFRQGAEMNHQAKATLHNGNNELILENISNNIDINSLQVNCSGAVTVMGVEFGTDYLRQESKAGFVTMLEDSLELVNEAITKNNTNIDLITDLVAVLKANKEIKGAQTGLSVAELVKLMDYYKAKSAELQTELAALRQKNIKLQQQAARIKNQLAEEEKKNSKVAGKLILQLNAAVAGRYDFIVTYITANAYWTPFYDLKAEHIKKPLKLAYRAKIFQTTGIDWKQVKLNLSTSTPSQSNIAPLLKSWFLSYINPVRYYNQALAKANTIQSIGYANGGEVPASSNLQEVVVTGYSSVKVRGSKSLDGSNEPLYIVNGAEMSATEFAKINPSVIASIQTIKEEEAEALYGSRAGAGAIVVSLKDGLDDYISVTDKELDITFEIDLPYDVPTNGKAQTAFLKEYEVPAACKFYAVPKLDKEVYLLAEVPDWEKLNLLPGEANIIFEGTYIGKSFIDPSSTQDTLNLTMGRDKRVVVKKEKLVDFSSIKFLGANKKQVFTYEITVKNNKKDPIDFLLKDQYPLSQNKEVEVELLEKSAAAENAETGVLTWALKLQPGETKKLRVSYSVKYPKDKVLNL
ncbi:MAG: hypothetical protein RL172_1455 [Bacteroidota bacterium]